MRSEFGLTVAVDIGGTFTDIALSDPNSGQIWRAKTPSVPSDPSQAFVAGVRLALDKASRAPGDIGKVLHGTTVATNMILENKGAKAALVTTRGFRHVLAIGRQDIPRKANLYAWIKPARPVPASRVVEITERIAAGGSVLTPLDEDSVRKAAAAIRRMEVDAVAICLLHSFANPDHERRAAAILAEELPGVAITASVDVLPVVREFERTLATTLNAVVTPGVATYVGRLETRLKEMGVAAPLLLMQSNGGVAGAPRIRQAAVTTALSGPAAGVIGARQIAAACDIDNIMTVDIGGTSADICLMEKGRIGLTQTGHVGSWPLPLPMIDMVTIGAGGGSIARVRNGGLVVGPESAGAAPGPAAYGRGGEMATVTDAHVVLGHLTANLLSGAMSLDAEAARNAVRRNVAEPLGLSLEEAARGILSVVDNNMVGALRVVSVERGRNPRDFTLVPFGGAGPLHGCALADLLGMRRILVPVAPGVLCADGLLGADIRAEFSRTLPRAGAVDMGTAAAIFAELEAEAERWLDAERIPAAKRGRTRTVLMRYSGQGGETPTSWADTREALEGSFVATHKSLYGFTLDAAIECVTLRVEAVGHVAEILKPSQQPGSGAVPVGRQPMWVEGAWREVPLYDRARLGAGDRLEGPALITQLDSTTLVTPGWTVTVHATGALVMERS